MLFLSLRIFFFLLVYLRPSLFAVYSFFIFLKMLSARIIQNEKKEFLNSLEKELLNFSSVISLYKKNNRLICKILRLYQSVSTENL